MDIVNDRNANPIVGIPIPKTGWSSHEEFVEAVDDAGIGWRVLALDGDGTLTIVEECERYPSEHLVEDRAAGVIVVKITVFIGKVAVKTLACKVLAGVIIEVVATAVDAIYNIVKPKLLGKPVPPNNRLVLPCSIYPPHSGEYHRCMGS